MPRVVTHGRLECKKKFSECFMHRSCHCNPIRYVIDAHEIEAQLLNRWEVSIQNLPYSGNVNRRHLV